MSQPFLTIRTAEGKRTAAENGITAQQYADDIAALVAKGLPDTALKEDVVIDRCAYCTSTSTKQMAHVGECDIYTWAACDEHAVTVRS